MTNKERFTRAKCGMMIHFGLYSILGGECGTGGGNKTGGKAVGERYGLYECPVTTCESWGWKTDCKWKTPEALKAAKDRLNSQGVNYLLNIGPDYLGRLPLTALDILKKMREL